MRKDKRTPDATITAIQVIDSALAAIEKGTLQLSSCPTTMKGFTGYWGRAFPAYLTRIDGKEYHCAIGSALPNMVLYSLSHSWHEKAIGELARIGFVGAPKGDRRLISNIQKKHDTLWDDLVRGKKSREEAVAEFVQYLNRAKRAKLAAQRRGAQQ